MAASPPANPNDPVRGSITVYADSSFQGVMPLLASDFTTIHPKAKVQFVFGSTPSLVSKLPGSADVIAVVGTNSLEGAVSDHTVQHTSTFARDPMALAVTQKNPGGIAQFSDVAKPDVSLAVCDSSQPCGEVSDVVISRSGVQPGNVQRLSDSPAVLSAVSSGQVDAGLVLSSDLESSQATSEMLKRVEFSSDDNLTDQSASQATVPCLVAPVNAGGNTTTANAFIDELSSDNSRSTLADSGFGK